MVYLQDYVKTLSN